MNEVESLLKSLFVMASMVEARDPYTGGHLWRVSQFSRLLAEHAGLEPGAVARIALAGFLHDLGKVGIPDAILNKPGRLTEQEYDIIKIHPEVGHRLLAEHPLADLARAAVYAHHEMPSGKGYPRGLAGDAIPLDARIVGVSDAFDAMTSTRPYRQGMSVDKALAIIGDNLASQFDAEHGGHLVSLARAGTFDPIIGFTEPGIPLQRCPVCGPTIVVTRAHGDGAKLYCPSCSSEFTLQRDGGVIAVSSTGGRGTPNDVAPQADLDLIGELVRVGAPLLAPAGAKVDAAEFTGRLAA